MSRMSLFKRHVVSAGTARLSRWSKRLDDSLASYGELDPEPARVAFSAPHGLGFGRRQWPFAERQGAAADGGEQSVRLQLAGVADLAVVEARQPEPDRPLALGLGLL